MRQNIPIETLKQWAAKVDKLGDLAGIEISWAAQNVTIGRMIGSGTSVTIFQTKYHETVLGCAMAVNPQTAFNMALYDAIGYVANAFQSELEATMQGSVTLRAQLAKIQGLIQD